MKAETTFSLKDQLFNKEKVGYLSGRIQDVYPAFEGQNFSRKVVRSFPDLELKERISHITDCLQEFLPTDYLLARDILLDSLPEELDPTKSDGDFGDFIFAPLSLYVARFGCTRQYLEESLAAIREITKRFSAEYAVRFFLNAFPEKTMSFLTACTGDDHYHVRRLASEGTRPKLPWAQKISLDHTMALLLLDNLFYDDTRFVTRSVANHLNDISKIDPKLVIATLKRWKKSGRQDKTEMSFVVRHSLRTLTKRGDKSALQLLGYRSNPKVRIKSLQTSTPEVKVGEAFVFGFDVIAQQKEKLLIDYEMTFANSGSKAGGKKVFQIKQVELGVDESISLSKKHPMRLMTTRRLYTGRHIVEVRVNGKVFGSVEFELLA